MIGVGQFVVAVTVNIKGVKGAINAEGGLLLVVESYFGKSRAGDG